MYLKRVHLENIRSHSDLTIEFEEGGYAGWHVIIGDNGSGKSSLVRAIALALAGPWEAPALRQDWRDWLRGGSKTEVGHSGAIRLIVHSDDRFDEPSADTEIRAELVFMTAPSERNGPRVGLAVDHRDNKDAGSHVWGTGTGWFSASYGPFRRFTGGNKDYEKLFYSNPKLAPHLTVFGEDVALTEALTWLQSVRVRVLEHELPSTVLENLARFVNDSGLLPHGTRLDNVSATAVTFVDGGGYAVPVEQLSDGYRSILSLTFELVRQLANAYGEAAVWEQLEKETITFDLPGVVMIDEIDAHLHPTWQRRIGQWFCQQFPKLQFIVTTHSPLICQAAVDGTIWQLPKPGSTGIRKIEGTLRDRLIYGSVLDALDTDLFGEDVARSDAARELLVRLAELNLRSLRGQLSEAEREELDRLRRTFPSSTDEGIADS